MILDFAERHRELTSDLKKPVWQEIVDVTQPPCIGIGIAFAAPTTTTTTLKSKQSKDKRTLSTVEHGLTLEGPIREKGLFSFHLIFAWNETKNKILVWQKNRSKMSKLKVSNLLLKSRSFFLVDRQRRLSSFRDEPKLKRRLEQLQAANDVLPFSKFLTDTFGRQHTYLRISLTEKCNLRYDVTCLKTILRQILG